MHGIAQEKVYTCVYIYVFKEDEERTREKNKNKKKRFQKKKKKSDKYSAGCVIENSALVISTSGMLYTHLSYIYILFIIYTKTLYKHITYI